MTQADAVTALCTALLACVGGKVIAGQLDRERPAISHLVAWQIADAAVGWPQEGAAGVWRQRRRLTVQVDALNAPETLQRVTLLLMAWGSETRALQAAGVVVQIIGPIANLTGVGDTTYALRESLTLDVSYRATAAVTGDRPARRLVLNAYVPVEEIEAEPLFVVDLEAP